MQQLATDVPSLKATLTTNGRRTSVGDFEVTVVTDGMDTKPLSDSYVANAPKADVNAALAADFLAKDRVSHYYTPIVVNTGSKLVAIDTGLGLGMFEQSKGEVGQYHGNLQAAGIDRNAVDVVIISHFHADHINGLIGPQNKPAFPNAEIMVPEIEAAFWADENNTKVTKYQADQAGKELVPGITAIASPGHTPGHISYVVASGNDKVLVQSDITAGAVTLFARNPDWQFEFDTDKPEAVETRKKLYDMASADKMLVQAYHVAFPSLVYVERNGNGYRLVPAPWSPSI